MSTRTCPFADMGMMASASQLHINLASPSSSGTPPLMTPSFQPNTPGVGAGAGSNHHNGSSYHHNKSNGEEETHDDLDLNLPISTLLKLGTQRAHVKAEHSAGAAALVQGGLGLEEYIRWLAVLWRIYDALELGLAENSSNSVLAPTYDPALLARAPALAEDISYLLTLLPPTSNAATPSSIPTTEPSTPLPPFPLPSFLLPIFTSPPGPLLAYLSHVQRLASSSSTAPRLLAHAYVRYLGDLSGGQFIGARVKKSYGLKGDQGALFYHFDFQKGSGGMEGGESRSDVKKRLAEVKDWYRRGMDEGVGEDQRLKADLVEEANLAFSYNTDLFSVIRLPSKGEKTASPETDAQVTTDNKVMPIVKSSKTRDAISQALWFLAAAGFGVVLNIYLGPFVNVWLKSHGYIN
ncbi:hypothetical protein IAR55_006966 [Kwoniella newhampshirensis]|uniref:Heme oxygenase 2 n=1 Tax=Kwoniella newhampshirensis TaxID=1651941 RepID=A0AAW0YT19_9TREE